MHHVDLDPNYSLPLFIFLILSLSEIYTRWSALGLKKCDVASFHLDDPHLNPSKCYFGRVRVVFFPPSFQLSKLQIHFWENFTNRLASSCQRLNTPGCKSEPESTDLALVPATLTPTPHHHPGPRPSVRATGDADAAVEEFIADLIRRDLKLVAADQSCYVLHVVKGAYKKKRVRR